MEQEVKVEKTLISQVAGESADEAPCRPEAEFAAWLGMTKSKGLARKGRIAPAPCPFCGRVALKRSLPKLRRLSL